MVSFWPWMISKISFWRVRTIIIEHKGGHMNAPYKLDLDPQTATERLIRIQDDIINEFAITVTQEIESARKVPREGLIDAMPGFLENLRASLLLGQTSFVKQHSTAIGLAHGKVR